MDTGSNISIVRPDVLRGLGEGLLQPVRSCLRTVTGERAPIHGKGRLELGIGTMKLSQDMWVADISDECILGLDFLEPNRCQVNLKDGALIIGEEEIPLERSNMTTEPACNKAILLDAVCLPSLSEMVVPVKVDTAGASSRWGILGRSRSKEVSRASDCLLVGRTLVDLYHERTPLRVMNVSSQQQRIPKGTELAECEIISGVVMPAAEAVGGLTGCVQGAGTTNRLPNHMRDLYERSVVGLGPQDSGCTDLVQHHIHMGQTPPIRQPPRRLPLSRREEAEMAIQDKHTQGVIEPAASPWSSPVVLAITKKKHSLKKAS